MHKRFVHLAAGVSAGVLILLATSASVANPVVADISFTGTAQTATWTTTYNGTAGQGAGEGFFNIHIPGTGIVGGFPFISDPPGLQSETVTQAGGPQIVTATPVSRTDDNNPTGSTAGPTPITTQMTFGAFDWEIQDIDNFHVDFLDFTVQGSDFNRFVHEILVLSIVPGVLNFDLFHENVQFAVRQSAAPTFATDGSGSFTMPVFIGAQFGATFELGRPDGSESVHGTGTDLATGEPTIEEFVDLDGIPGPDTFTFAGTVTTTTVGDLFGVGGTPGLRDVLLEIDGSMTSDLPFDFDVPFSVDLAPLFAATGTLLLFTTIESSMVYHLEQLLTDVHRLKGDITGDGDVDIGDFVSWANAFSDTGDGSQVEDISMDGDVDIGDFVLWANQFGATGNSSAGGGGGASAVPEPSSMVLLGIGVFGLVAYRWRRRRSA